MNKVFRIYDKNSCYIFHGESWFRRMVVKLSCWPLFDNFIILLILVNSVTLAIYDYTDRDSQTTWNKSIEFVGNIFTYIFIGEAAIKIIAMGFFMHKNAYLRDAWNWLDFIVVCIGIIENIPGIPKLKALRTMRVLRPLRSVNAFPEMRRLIGSLLGSIPELGTAVVFLLFIFLLFGILGVQQFNGALYQRCRVGTEPTWNPETKKYFWEKAEGIDRLCSLEEGQGAFMCPKEFTCGSPTHSNALPKPYKLDNKYFATMIESEDYINDDLIAYDIANFNNLIWAMESIFVMITLEGWSGLMYNLTDASLIWMAIAFCILLVVVGSFFLLNVILAVIMDSFDKVDRMQVLIEEKKRQEIAAQKRACGIISSDEEDDQDDAKSIDADHAPDIKPSNINQIVDESGIDKQKVDGQIEMASLSNKPQGSTDNLENTQNFKQTGAVDPSMEQLMGATGNDSQTQKLLRDAKRGDLTDDEVLKMELQSQPKEGNIAKNSIQAHPQSKQKENKADEEQLPELDDDLPLRARNNKIYLFFYRICMHDLFTFSMTAAILINTLVLALDQYPITYETQSYLEFVNSLLSYIFIVEMVIKVMGMGIKEYTSDSFNIFDGTIVFISIFEMIIEQFFEGGLGGGAFSSLRAVRLLRVFKLARSWTSFRELLAKMIVTLKDIQFFGALMILFLFIFTLLGMELFAYRVKFNNDDHGEPVDDTFPDPYYPRASFNEFFTGFTTIFIVFIGEDWNSVMYDHARSQTDTVQKAGTIVIFIFIFIVGNLILLNLFLAILLKNFEEPPGKDTVEDTGPSAFSIFKEMLMAKMDQCCTCFGKSNEKQVSDENQIVEGNAPEDEELNAQQNPMTPSSKKSQPIVDRDSAQRSNGSSPRDKDGQPKRSLQGLGQKARTENKNDADIGEDSEMSPKRLAAEKKKHFQTKKSFSELKKSMLDQNYGSGGGSPNPKILMKLKTMELSEKSSNTQRFSISAIKQMEVEASEKPKRKAMVVTGKSLFLMKPDNFIRKWSTSVVSHPYFDNIILFLIVFSTFLLILETPLNDPNSKMADNLFYIDVVVTFFFTMELILKVIVMGFIINGSESYIRNPWNMMDFVIVAFSIISIAFKDSGGDLGAIKTLRMLRVLRPLRMISRNPGLKIAVNSLLNAIPFIGDVIVVCLLFLLLFAILCTNFYKGQLFSCQINTEIIYDGEDPPNEVLQRAVEQLESNIENHVVTKFQCLDYGGEWENTDSNFDNVGQAMITLFNVMTTEGWIDVMFTALDSNEIEKVPIVDGNFGMAVVFFLLIIFFFHLFILNMFVGIVINVFSDEKQNLEMNHLLTQMELDWCEVLIYCYKNEPIQKFLITGNKIKDTCYAIAMNQYFDKFIIFCIIFNTGCMAFTWHGEPPGVKEQLYFFNLTFNIIYTIEAVVKLIAFDKDYFVDGWNNFDFIIVIAAWFGFITDELGLEIGASTNVIRIFRICRIFKIIKKFKSLRILFYTFIGAIPQLTNVGGLLGLFLFLYTVLGVEFFATVKLQEELNIHANFQTFGSALKTLFRMATGESWQAIMYDCARQQSIIFPCTPKPTYETMFVAEGEPLNIDGCGDNLKSRAFFVSFMVIVSFIFLNLFIAIILESFDSSKDEEGLQVGGDTIGKFNEIWSNDRFDPKGTKFIKIKEFPDFLKMIIDEEIKQRLVYNEALRKGEIDIEDQLEGVKIFMFNIHSDAILLPVSFARKPIIYQQMIDEGDLDDPNQNQPSEPAEEAAEGEEQESPMAEGGQLSEEERKRINDAKKQRQQDEIMEKHIDQFIGTLEIPCYDKCTTFYYYDVLEALSRHLFQQLIDHEKEKLEEEKLLMESDTDSMASKSMNDNNSQKSSPRDGNNEKEKKKDTEGSEEVEDELTEREIENREDILKGSLEEILKKLEEKGAEHKEIEKYKEMRLWRLKRDKIVRQQLEQFNYETSEGDKKKSIIDSSQLIGARVIHKYTKRWLDKKRAGSSGNPVQNNQNIKSELLQDKRDAKVLEKEVMRKQRAANQSLENNYNPMMPQINEAENEDRDFHGDNHIAGKSRNVKGVTTGAGGVGNEIDPAYSTFQKDSEPGNKQGDDAPVEEGGMRNYVSSPDDGTIHRDSTGEGPRQGMNMAMEGSSFDEYNCHNESEYQDIQSVNKDDEAAGQQHKRNSSVPPPNAEPNAGD